MSSPPRPLFLFFLLVLPFLLFDRAAGFLPTAYCRRPARADAVKAGRFFSGHHPPGGLGLYSNRARRQRLDGSGVDYTPFCYLSVLSVSAHYSDDGCCFFGRRCHEVHGACDNRINLYPAAPIRLAKVLLAWTIAQAGWGSSSERQIGKCQFAMRTHSHTSDLPRHAQLGGVGTQRTVDVIA